RSLILPAAALTADIVALTAWALSREPPLLGECRLPDGGNPPPGPEPPLSGSTWKGAPDARISSPAELDDSRCSHGSALPLCRLAVPGACPPSDTRTARWHGAAAGGGHLRRPAPVREG